MREAEQTADLGRRSLLAVAAAAIAGLSPPRVSAAEPKRSVDGPGLHHIGLFVPDVEKAIKFYTDGLGFKLKYRWPDTVGKQGDEKYANPSAGVFLDAGDGNYIELLSSGNAKLATPGFPLNHFSLRVADISKAYKAAIAAGAKPYEFKFPDKTWDGAPLDVTTGGDDPTKFQVAFVLGPAGELIEFFQNARL